MKKFSIILALLTMVSVGCGRMETAANSDLDGYFATKKIADPYFYFNHQPDFNDIYSYIISSNPDYNDATYDAFHLADTVDVLSRDLKIDAYVFASLLRKESRFKRTAVSPTGAVGFSQMTGKAISEVNDQLGMRGAGGARLDTTAYFRGIVVPDYQTLSGKTWQDLWNVDNPKDVLRSEEH